MLEAVANVIFAIGRTDATGVRLLGTGFAVDRDKIATTAHVSGISDADLVAVLPRYRSLSDFQDTTDQAIRMIKLHLFRHDPVHDIAILSIESGSIEFPYKLGKVDDVQVGSDVAIFGFPHADQGRLVLTMQRTEIGARVLLGSRGVRSKHVVLNIQARPGQSGGPVFTPDGQKLAAMVLGSFAPGGGGGISLGGIDPHSLHQTTHAISAEYISELLQ
ncbi:MAG: S1 family peptidase [Methylocystis sp.]